MHVNLNMITYSRWLWLLLQKLFMHHCKKTFFWCIHNVDVLLRTYRSKVVVLQLVHSVLFCGQLSSSHHSRDLIGRLGVASLHGRWPLPRRRVVYPESGCHGNHLFLFLSLLLLGLSLLSCHSFTVLILTWFFKKRMRGSNISVSMCGIWGAAGALHIQLSDVIPSWGQSSQTLGLTHLAFGACILLLWRHYCVYGCGVHAHAHHAWHVWARVRNNSRGRVVLRVASSTSKSELVQLQLQLLLWSGRTSCALLFSPASYSDVWRCRDRAERKWPGK